MRHISSFRPGQSAEANSHLNHEIVNTLNYCLSCWFFPLKKTKLQLYALAWLDKGSLHKTRHILKNTELDYTSQNALWKLMLTCCIRLWVKNLICAESSGGCMDAARQKELFLASGCLQCIMVCWGSCNWGAFTKMWQLHCFCHLGVLQLSFNQAALVTYQYDYKFSTTGTKVL